MLAPSLDDPKLCRLLLDRLEVLLGKLPRPLRFMEVCGTHTVSIFRSGLRQMLPENIIHLSGPGCPVCVTDDIEIAKILYLSRQKEVIIATFGDLTRVPDAEGKSLRNATADGAKVQIVYSPMDALTLAENSPDETVIFIGVGFETTAPAVAAAVLTAKQKGIRNFAVYSCHKLVPPALEMLLSEQNCPIDAFLLPGHVSTVIGEKPYRFVAEKYRKPAVIGGFEPADILNALCHIAEQSVNNNPHIENVYHRAVSPEGNIKAQNLLKEVFVTVDAPWRGLGILPNSGLRIAPAYRNFDAEQRFDLGQVTPPHASGCQCGEILRGRMTPPQCPLFAKRCTPANPVGPCMVSTEGSCAAYYKYNL